jgi:hypothetical protein
MHWLRSTGRLPRTLFAVLFGLISLVQLPIITTTAANAAFSNWSQLPPPTDHAHHQHHDHGRMQASNDAPYVPPVPSCDTICFGCLQSLTPALGDDPVMRSLAFGVLRPALSDAMRGAPADPAVPPPRLQA